MRGAAKPRVNTQALIPERSGVGNLRHRAPEKDGGEIGDPTDMAQRLQDQCGRLPATSRAAIFAANGNAMPHASSVEVVCCVALAEPVPVGGAPTLFSGPAE